MKISIFLLGLLVSLIGLLPILTEVNVKFSFLDFIPLSGITYNIIVLILGVLILYFTVKGKKRRKDE